MNMKRYYAFLSDRDVNGIKNRCKNVNVTFLCDKKDETCSAFVDGDCHCFDCYHTDNSKHKIKKAMRFFEILYFKGEINLFEGDIETLNFVRANKESLEAHKDDIIFVAAKLEELLEKSKIDGESIDEYDDLETFQKSFEERILHRGRYKWGGDTK